MKAQRRDIFIGALAAIVVGVAAVGVAIGVAALRPPSGMASPQTDASAAANGRPDAPAPIRYVCIRDHAAFTIEDIENAPAANARGDPARDLLLTLLDEQAGIEESVLPVDGWLRVVDTSEEVVLLAETPGGAAPYAVVHVVPGNVGAITENGWAVDSYGACTPRPEVADDVSVAQWWVDPGAEPIGPESERILAQVHELACASGESADGRILAPTIAYGTDDVTVTVIVESVEGFAECPGNPLTPYLIELDEPLGDRVLLDGGQVPPGDPLEEPDP